MYHGWEGHLGVAMINVHLTLFALAIIPPIGAKAGKVYVSSLSEIYPPSMDLDLSSSLCTLGSSDTTWMETDPNPLVLKPKSVCEVSIVQYPLS